MEKANIRPARPEDAAVLKDLTKVLGYEITAANLQENLQEILDHPELHFLYLAENDHQEVIGYIEGYVYESLLIAKEIRVMGIAVLEAYQDQGIGGQLLDYLENQPNQKLSCQRRYRGINDNKERRHCLLSSLSLVCHHLWLQLLIRLERLEQSYQLE